MHRLHMHLGIQPVPDVLAILRSTLLVETKCGTGHLVMHRIAARPGVALILVLWSVGGVHGPHAGRACAGRPWGDLPMARTNAFTAADASGTTTSSSIHVADRPVPSPMQSRWPMGRIPRSRRIRRHLFGQHPRPCNPAGRILDLSTWRSDGGRRPATRISGCAVGARTRWTPAGARRSWLRHHQRTGQRPGLTFPRRSGNNKTPGFPGVLCWWTYSKRKRTPCAFPVT